MPVTFRTENEYGSGEVRSWASILDDNCREQAERISRVPILHGYLALMPDAHFGFGPPVGSALKMRGAIMPYAVGVDIGCGMIACRTSIERPDLAGKEGRILGQIRTLIPSGVGTAHSQPTEASAAFFARYGKPPGIDAPWQKKQNGKTPGRTRAPLDSARIQFGTLGAGNHFVEVCEDDEGMVWLLLHSGSRGIGNHLATMHVRAAQEFATREGVSLEDRDFAWVPQVSKQFTAYIADMLWAQRYAFEQRVAMMAALVEAVRREAGAFETEPPINCHHNYAEELRPGLWLARKGAIDASAGRLGIIPGSMGAATYIVRGKGNAEAYETAPHGAGRVLGRNVAKKTLSLADFKAQMKGRTWLDRSATALLDEAPGAYKPIEQVIADSADLIETVTVLSQFINYKGL